MSESIAFTSLSWRQRKIAAGYHSYRIYKPDGSFVSVEAPTAAEAFKLSGISNATKIIREYHAHALIIEQGVLAEDGTASDSAKAETTPTPIMHAPRENGNAASVAAVPSEMTIPPMQADASAGNNGVPQFVNHELSKEEVNKLLGN